MGKIVDIKVSFVVEMEEGSQQHTTVDLEEMIKYCREERVQDLVDDAGMLLEDVLAGRATGVPALSAVRGRR